MSNTLISFFIAISASTWIYSKVARSTGGGNPRDSIIVASISGLVIFGLAYFLLGFVPK